MIIDTHAHYDDKAFSEDRDELLSSKLLESGIDIVVNIGANIETSKQTIELTQKYPNVYGAIGVHPSDTAELDEENFLWLSQAVKDEKIVAVGEIGLDYYWEEPEHAVQKKWFRRQLGLAQEIKKPVVIHSRDAAADTLDIMKTEHAEKTGGVIHCFSYSIEMAREYLNMGMYLGIGGVLTFNNAKKLKEVVKFAPMDRLVLETDSPYLAPAPNRGKRNSSLNLPYVITAISELKSIPEEEVRRITTANAKTLYRLKI